MKRSAQPIVEPPSQPTGVASCYCGGSTVSFRIGGPWHEERDAVASAKAACPRCSS